MSDPVQEQEQQQAVGDVVTPSDTQPIEPGEPSSGVQQDTAATGAAAPLGAPGAPLSEQDLNPANAVDGGRKVSNKILYVGNLSKSITEDGLKDIFSVSSPVHSVKILFDKNQQAVNYAFVEYETTEGAEAAAQSLNGRVLDNFPLRINWAYQSQQMKSSDLFNVFVGDLSPEVNDELLAKTFGRFPSLSQAHVMWDMQTGRSRGYGFLSFQDQQDAEVAIATMNGEWIAGRAIRLNWAAYKQQQQQQQQQSQQQHQQQFQNHNLHQHQQQQQQQQMSGMLPMQHHRGSGGSFSNGMSNNGNGSITGGGAPDGSFPILGPQSFEMVARQAPAYNTTVYLGNLSHYTTENDIIPALQQFGFIVDFKFHPERGCAFVKFDTHERAAIAIVSLNGVLINGRQIKSNWGKTDFRNSYKQSAPPSQAMPIPQMYGQRFN